MKCALTLSFDCIKKTLLAVRPPCGLPFPDNDTSRGALPSPAFYFLCVLTTLSGPLRHDHSKKFPINGTTHPLLPSPFLICFPIPPFFSLPPPASRLTTLHDLIKHRRLDSPFRRPFLSKPKTLGQLVRAYCFQWPWVATRPRRVQPTQDVSNPSKALKSPPPTKTASSPHCTRH